MTINNISIGADPELFIVNSKNNKVISAIGIIPGEKGNPYKADDMPYGFGLEIDNILAEFNIPPCFCKEDFVRSIEYMKDYIDKFVKKVNSDLTISCSASRIVTKDQLNSPEALLFGCSPDYNVYTESENPKPEGESTNIRSAGFHIHLGYANHNITTSLSLVKYLDIYVGLPSIIRDRDKRRRSLYGKAGSFRLTDYGVEWRVLSSAMMKDTETIAFVYDQIIKAIKAYNAGVNFPNLKLVQEAINNSDTVLAKKIIKEYNIL